MKSLQHVQPGIIYLADNGRAVCSKCAGQRALTTGRDLSGDKIIALTGDALTEWRAVFGKKNPKCEQGCTTYVPPVVVNPLAEKSADEIKGTIGMLQEIQKTNPATSMRWKYASTALAPLFIEMANRQLRGEL
jgi:hypothetical protein